MVDNNVAIDRAPFFDGMNYPYWKMRMETYIKANDFDSWQVILLGDTQVTMNGDGHITPDQKKAIEKNNKAKNLLLTTIASSEFYLFSSCSTAKQIWDTLSETYEGTRTIKDTKINALLQRYELFKFKPNEKVKDAFDRFVAITNELASLGKKLEESDLVRKILRILPKSWDAKKTAIEEANDLSTLSLSQLKEKLMAYQSHIDVTEESEGSKKETAFKTEKVDDDSDSDSSSDEDEEVNSLVRHLNKILKKQGKKTVKYKKYYSTCDVGKGYKEKEKKKEKKEVVCYECKKPGHIKYECPVLMKKMEKHKKKHRSLLATWSDLDESETKSESTSEDEEEANLCLMATSEVNSESEIEMNDNEMYIEMKKLLKALKKADLKNSKLDAENKALKNEKDVLKQINKLLVDENDILKNDNEKLFVKSDVLKKENDVLKNEIKDLKGRVEDLSQSIKNTFSKFNESDKKLNMLISSQRPSFIKHGLGYEHENSTNSMNKTVFVKANESGNEKDVMQSVKKRMNGNSRGYIRRYTQQNYPIRTYGRGYRYAYNNYPRQNYYQKVNQRYNTHPYACSFCNRRGHIEKYCFYKRNKLSDQQGNKFFNGPKLVWVRKKV